MIKIKQNSKVFWRILIVMIGINIAYLVRNILTNMPVLQPLKGSLIFLIVFGMVLYLIEKGNWIKINNDVLNISQEYFKSNYDLSKIEKIYYKNHFYLGPTLFMAYLNKEKRLLLLSQYKKEDIKNLLLFLKKNNVQLDQYCENIITSGVN